MNFLRDFWRELVAAWKAGEPPRDALWYFLRGHITQEEFVYLDEHPGWFSPENSFEVEVVD